jgi:hypothetical protein
MATFRLFGFIPMAQEIVGYTRLMPLTKRIRIKEKRVITSLVWLLVTVSEGSYNRGTVTYSPPLATLEDCQRIATQIQTPAVSSYCVQVNIKDKK